MYTYIGAPLSRAQYIRNFLWHYSMSTEIERFEAFFISKVSFGCGWLPPGDPLYSKYDVTDIC
jgi:hypothetical protein